MTKCWSKHVEIGNLVYHVDDPRHIGRIRMINWSHTALVEWQETGWFSEVLMDQLRRYNPRREV